MNTAASFRRLRRVNAVLIFLAVSGMIGIVGFAILFMVLDLGGCALRPRTAVRLDSQEDARPKHLNQFYPVSGSSYLRAGLFYGDSRAYYSSAKSDGSPRNYIFLNAETLESRWLLDSDRQLLVGCDELSTRPQSGAEAGQESGNDSPSAHAVAFFYQTIDSDTNGDKRLSWGDRISLAYSRADGSDYTRVIEGVGDLLGTGTVEHGTKHVVVYEADGKWLTAVVSLADFTIEKRGELPVSP